MGKVLKRRWFQFTLRTVFGLVTIFCIGLGWWASRAHQQRLAVQQIRAMGGTVVYEPRIDALRVPTWIRSYTGDDFFVTAVSVSLALPTKSQVDQAVGEMRRLPRVRELVLGQAQLSDDDLARLAPLRNQLESIQFHEGFRTELTGEGFRYFSGWPRLRSLAFQAGGPGTTALQWTAEIPRLEQLTLSRCNLDAQVFSALRKCRHLRTLHLSQCSFSGAAVLELKGAPRLETLSLLNVSGESAGWPPEVAAQDDPRQYRFSAGGVPLGLFSPTSPQALSSTQAIQWLERILPGVQVSTGYISN